MKCLLCSSPTRDFCLFALEYYLCLSLVSPRFWFCFSRVNSHSLSEFIKQYPSSFRKSWVSPLYCVFLGCSKKKRLKTHHPLRFLLEAWCSPGTTFSLHLSSPSIPGKLHVEKWTAEHSSRKDHHVVPYWIVWMHTPGVHMPARSKIKREIRECINSLSQTLVLSCTELPKIVHLFTQPQQIMKFTLSKVTGVWNKSTVYRWSELIA